MSKNVPLHKISKGKSSNLFDKVVDLTFLDDDVRRRFNITACKGKGWLPQDYGHEPFEQLSYEKQELVKSFEGEKTYNENIGDCSFRIKTPKNLLLT